MAELDVYCNQFTVRLQQKYDESYFYLCEPLMKIYALCVTKSKLISQRQETYKIVLFSKSYMTGKLLNRSHFVCDYCYGNRSKRSADDSKLVPLIEQFWARQICKMMMSAVHSVHFKTEKVCNQVPSKPLSSTISTIIDMPNCKKFIQRSFVTKFPSCQRVILNFLIHLQVILKHVQVNPIHLTRHLIGSQQNISTCS